MGDCQSSLIKGQHARHFGNCLAAGGMGPKSAPRDAQDWRTQDWRTQGWPAQGWRAQGWRSEDFGDRGCRHRRAVGSAQGRQAIFGPLLDQKSDQCQPLVFVDRVGEQLPIAIIVESRVLFTHVTPPSEHTLHPRKVFPS